MNIQVYRCFIKVLFPIDTTANVRTNCFSESLAVQFFKTEREMDIEPNYR